MTVQLHTEPRALRRSVSGSGRSTFLDEVRKTCASAGIDYVLMNTKDPLDAAAGGLLDIPPESPPAVRDAPLMLQPGSSFDSDAGFCPALLELL